MSSVNPVYWKSFHCNCCVRKVPVGQGFKCNLGHILKSGAVTHIDLLMGGGPPAAAVKGWQGDDASQGEVKLARHAVVSKSLQEQSRLWGTSSCS